MTAPLRVSLPDQKLVDALEPASGVEFFVWDFSGPAPAGRLDIVVPPYMRGPEVLAALESVEIGLVQSQSIGYDGVADVLPAGCLFANAAGVHETSTAELALGMMIAAQSDQPWMVSTGSAASSIRQVETRSLSAIGSSMRPMFDVCFQMRAR